MHIGSTRGWVSAGSTESMHSVLTGTLAVCAIDVVIGLQAVVARNPSSYISSFSLLFIDHPAPTGFSVTVNPVGTQEENAAQYVAAVKTIIRRHNVPLANGLYFSGESYAGQCDFDSNSPKTNSLLQSLDLLWIFIYFYRTSDANE